jgi:4-alpha-glucanotransferase
MAEGPWGVTDGYEDALGVWHVAAPEARAAVLTAMGVDETEPAPVEPPVLVVRRGETRALGGPAELHLEDGARVRVEATLPADLPLGYHTLVPLDGRDPRRLIVSPGVCHLPSALKAWGWAVQLYATRSRESWGFGDLADLRRLGRWSARALGAGFLLLNPLHAVSPTTPQQTSPYYPSSRRFLNPLYLRVEDVPGADVAGLDLGGLAAAARGLNRERRIDRDAVFALKMDALQRIWGRSIPPDTLLRFRAERGRGLERFALFCALAERYGAAWDRWPAEYRRADGPAAARFGREHAARVDFHVWLQWLLDRQLRTAGAEIALIHDLPIGVDPGGADAWEWQDEMALTASVGAPPDRYVRRGQDWGLPPFVPHRLRTTAYRPFIETIQATLRHAGGLRIDHVMGLFRLWWIPEGASPGEGVYVRYPADDLLGILALESHRAGALVVGEDLGTVEHGVRERLAAHRVLSYRVLWFESAAPSTFPSLALAAATTHDLPTIAGLWTGEDVAAQARIGLEPNVDALEQTRRRLAALVGMSDGAPVDEVIAGTYAALAQAPCAALTPTLEDALGVTERPNMPSTVDQWPNWSLGLPQSLEDIEGLRLPRRIASSLNHRSGQPPDLDKSQRHI